MSKPKDIQAHKLFRFKRFSLTDQGCAMKIGTDSVLLGAYTANLARLSIPERILDIGTGCGIVALMAAQKSTGCIDAIDKDEGAVATAIVNFENSPWQERLNAYHCALQQYKTQHNELYDLICCNPPYFQNSLQSHNTARSLARHNHSLNYNDLFYHSARLLKADGTCVMIHPYEMLEEVSIQARKAGLFEKSRLTISASPGHAPKRVINEYTPKEYSSLHISSMNIETGTRHCFSDAYKSLTFDYHPFFA